MKKLLFICLSMTCILLSCNNNSTDTKINTCTENDNLMKYTSYIDVTNAGLDTVGWYWYNIKNGTTSDETPTSGTAGYGTHQVGKKNANALGIFDMSGNVWEWCYDWYDTISTGDPVGPASGSGRVARGGSWRFSAGGCCVAGRGYDFSDGRYDLLGFRVVRNAQ